MRTRAVLLLALVFLSCGVAPSPYRPRNAALRDVGLEFYPAYGDATRQRRPRAFLFFFGNDVGFWGPYRELAAALAADGVATAGFDVRDFLRALPDGEPARDSAFVARISPLVIMSRAELGADAVPVLLGGHSLGAEVASWLAAHAPPPGLVGVLALSPRAHGHLRITLGDLSNSVEPRERGSFVVAGQAAALAPAQRFALVRGANDRFGTADAAILRAGGARARRFEIPLAGHSLKRLLLVTPVVRAAIAWLLEPATSAPRQAAIDAVR